MCVFGEGWFCGQHYRLRGTDKLQPCCPGAGAGKEEGVTGEVGGAT